jgi:hypothetical protein
VESTSEDDLKRMPKLDDCSDVEYDVLGKSLLIRKSLSVQVCEEDVEQGSIFFILSLPLVIRYVV